ncbi:hypothetical protein F1735_20340 [Massilia sp. CCM 8694]|uniref:Uncharacterized protein n=1 Tax=Massilia genomosp. 1 TaxID=2609280 RepID=A0ABX0MPC5_9BURK|nr:hypothetical protein [Massilia genomosp. 1]
MAPGSSYRPRWAPPGSWYLDCCRLCRCPCRCHRRRRSRSWRRPRPAYRRGRRWSARAGARTSVWILSFSKYLRMVINLSLQRQVTRLHHTDDTCGNIYFFRQR